MSDNPIIARYIEQIERELDQAFVMARRVMKRHEPEQFDTDPDRSHYWGSLPMVALDIVHQIGGVSSFHQKCPDQEKEGIVAAADLVLHELEIMNKRAGEKR